MNGSYLAAATAKKENSLKKSYDSVFKSFDKFIENIQNWFVQ